MRRRAFNLRHYFLASERPHRRRFSHPPPIRLHDPVTRPSISGLLSRQTCPEYARPWLPTEAGNLQHCSLVREIPQTDGIPSMKRNPNHSALADGLRTGHKVLPQRGQCLCFERSLGGGRSRRLLPVERSGRNFWQKSHRQGKEVMDAATMMGTDLEETHRRDFGRDVYRGVDRVVAVNDRGRIETNKEFLVKAAGWR
ncbi:hypothetical protein HPP92_015629 [Vanilla planifolia]|uniref:Uncharacterized protein n=1 Tax=Vanilla planifolia TaxID=51239 RepID=A0A835URC2_VANPL|nr:hypothetical protein HPP92_016442 [Vanilla planifolia]KAG0471083.1 hypothetical protein HPP92_015629 [Vanilla planifolia]